MKITIVTAFWQRAHISGAYWMGISRLKDAAKAVGVRVTTSASVSPEDRANQELAEQHADRTYVVSNTPLSSKWNAACLAAKSLRPDFIYVMGSDDLVSNSLLLSQIEEMKSGTQHSGVSDFYIWCTLTGQALYWPGYPRDNIRYGRSIGLGRFYSKEILNSVQWKLWPESGASSGMDNLIDERMISMGIPLLAKPCSIWEGVALDLKSKTNIWGFEKWKRNRAYSADTTLLRSLFPEIRALEQRRLT
jgi:hypothetical protein